MLLPTRTSTFHPDGLSSGLSQGRTTIPCAFLLVCSMAVRFFADLWKHHSPIEPSGFLLWVSWLVFLLLEGFLCTSMLVGRSVWLLLFVFQVPRLVVWRI